MNGQLCYEIDINEFIDKNTLQKELKIGLMFMIDHNEDRQLLFREESSNHTNFLQLGVIAQYFMVYWEKLLKLLVQLNVYL